MDIQKERKAFEQHLTDTGLVEFAGYGFAVDECDEYLHEPTQVAWDSWLIGLNRAKAQAVPEGFNFGLAHDTKINDPKELLFRCLRNMKFEKGFRANQNWVHVKHMCCLGSTTATMLCRFFGVDPDGIKFEVIKAQGNNNERN